MSTHPVGSTGRPPRKVPLSLLLNQKVAVVPGVYPHPETVVNVLITGEVGLTVMVGPLDATAGAASNAERSVIRSSLFILIPFLRY